MSPTTGSSGGGRSTAVSRKRESFWLLLSSSFWGLGGLSLHRRFLFGFGIVSLSGERLRWPPTCLSVFWPPSLCNFWSDLRSKWGKEKYNVYFNVDNVLWLLRDNSMFCQWELIIFKMAQHFIKLPIIRACSTEVRHEHLQLLHGGCCYLLIASSCVAGWNLMKK